MNLFLAAGMDLPSNGNVPRRQDAAVSAPNEHQFRQIFYQEVLTGLLGYTPYSDKGEFSLSYEYRLRRKPVDVALGRFFAGGDGDQVVAPFELKGPNTAERDIDRLIYQAFELTADEIALLEKSLQGQI